MSSLPSGQLTGPIAVIDEPAVTSQMSNLQTQLSLAPVAGSHIFKTPDKVVTWTFACTKSLRPRLNNIF